RYARRACSGCCVPVLFFLPAHRSPLAPLFPYTTLFRSLYDQKLREGQKGIIKRVVITLLFNAILLELIIFQLFSALHIGTLYLVDRKSTRLNSSHVKISYAVFCLKKKITRNPEFEVKVT